MRSGHRDHPPLAQHGLGKPLRPGRVRQPGIENRLEQSIAARDRVADQENVGAVRHCLELGSLIAFDQLDAEFLQLMAHRRIDISVAAGHFMSSRSRNGGDTAHERAANTYDVQMHRWRFERVMVHKAQTATRASGAAIAWRRQPSANQA